ncbi:hypothetical protein ACVWWP_002429 [Bradyrhizobium sp. LM3.6]
MFETDQRAGSAAQAEARYENSQFYLSINRASGCPLREHQKRYLANANVSTQRGMTFVVLSNATIKRIRRSNPGHG